MARYGAQYRPLIPAGSLLGNCKQITWTGVCRVPLYLLTPDMQNRRIINRLLPEAGGADTARDHDLLAGSDIAVLAQVECDVVAHLLTESGEVAGGGREQADLNTPFGARTSRRGNELEKPRPGLGHPSSENGTLSLPAE